MIIDGFAHQLPDIDPAETEEWLDSLEAVVDQRGASRAQYLMARLTARAAQLSIGTPASVSTPYVNTIPPEREPWFPGDEDMERSIRRYLRWNAAAQVVRANKAADGIGGHLSTYASSAALYEVGFNHFFRGKEGGAGDHVYIQGHASPGIYARAFMEGRLSEADMDRFRLEVDLPGRTGRGLSSYPHPRMMPDFWEYPTVSMGLGPIMSIYQARFNKYLHNRRIDDTSGSRVWCFVGDGEVDEPETLGSISLAAREHLDNLTWVINCNLQRLDGPVRGNGKIIQELEAIFRGAGWNVIKVIWGRRWDELLARDTDGVLLNQMNTTVDGEFQRFATEDGSYIRERFFGPDPRLRAMVEHLSDDDLTALPRGGHDYAKVYAAYRAAVETKGVPTVILAKTVKGWTLGPGVEGANSTHQIKKMTSEQLMALRDRLHLQEQLPDSSLADGIPPYVLPAADSPEMQYLLERRRALDGPLPSREVRTTRPLKGPGEEPFAEILAGSGQQSASTTTAFTRLLRNLCRDEDLGPRVVPIIPDEARTFGMDSLFREIGIYASQGQLYEPVDHELLLSYRESTQGQILEEGITEAGALSSWIAAATSYAHRGVPMVPFFTFYSMFGFQRVGDLIWAAADARARGFLMGATAGRTTLLGEGLQHDDGHSHVLSSVVPACRSYDPAFAFETALVVRDGIRRMYPDDGPPGEDVFYYITLYNENYPMPPMPDDGDGGARVARGVIEGLYRWHEAPAGDGPEATILFSGTAWASAVEARDILAEHYGVRASLWSATSYQQLRMQALEVERWNRLHPLDPQRTPRVTEILADSSGPVVAVTDFMRAVPDQIERWIPRGRAYVSLGTDGFGRSDTREALRRFFETDAPHVVVAVLHALADAGVLEPSAAADAIGRYGIATEDAPSWITP
ncbi:MAG: pyruvate dehydrogenase (acetyl-transferring), homodimeric type [Microthrixaceae bacterium]|nr:pyruvate dehydrogenase (acetyl-transferring), homodimeric type [Microthrixaceae bacterium]